MELSALQNKEAQSVEIKIVGSIDTLSSTQLRDYLETFFGHCKEMILDFSEVSYITSAGLRVLLLCNEQMADGKLVLKNLNADVKEIFILTGFNELLNIQ